MINEAFWAVFAVAFTCSFFAFYTIDADAKEKNYRPAYLLGIAIIAWFTTICLFSAPLYITTISYDANGIVTGSTVQSTNTPQSAWAFYGYMAFATALCAIEGLFFVQFMMMMAVKELGDGLKDLTQH